MIDLVPARPLLVFVSVLAFATGCNWANPRFTKDLRDETEMQSVVLSHVPPGASEEQAQTFMESEGFEAAYETDGVYVKPKDGSDGRFYSRDELAEAQRDGVYLRDLQATHDVQARHKICFRRHDRPEGWRSFVPVNTVQDVMIETSDGFVIDVQASQWMLGT